MARLTKEQFLAIYEAVIREFGRPIKQPKWQHLPAGHMYFADYTRSGAPEPVAAAKRFLSKTVWGKPKSQGTRGPFSPTELVVRVLRGKSFFEARVRWVDLDKVNDRVVTLTGGDEVKVRAAAKGAAAQLNRDAR